MYSGTARAVDCARAGGYDGKQARSRSGLPPKGGPVADAPSDRAVPLDATVGSFDQLALPHGADLGP